MTVVRAAYIDEGTGKLKATLLPTTIPIQVTERGNYVEGVAYAVGDAFAYQAGRYLVRTAFTGAVTPDLSKTISMGIDTNSGVELASDGTHITMGAQAAGPALALPTTAVITLPNIDGSGNITVFTADGTPVTLVVVGGTVGAGGTVGDPPGAPTSLAGTAGSGSVALTWTAPADPGDSAITTYVVQYRIVGSGMWSTFTHAASTTPSITVTGLTGGEDYEFRVAATSAQGTGPWSSLDTETPNIAGLLFQDDFERSNGPVGNGWTIDNPTAAPTIVGGIVVGGTDATDVHRNDVASAGNAVFTWRVPANTQFNGVVRFFNDETSAKFIRVEDSVKLRIADFSLSGNGPRHNEVHDTPNLSVPGHDYDVVLVCNGLNVSLFVNGDAGPALTDAPYASNIGFGFNLSSPSRKLDRITVTELDA